MDGDSLDSRLQEFPISGQFQKMSPQVRQLTAILLLLEVLGRRKFDRSNLNDRPESNSFGVEVVAFLHYVFMFTSFPRI